MCASSFCANRPSSEEVYKQDERGLPAHKRPLLSLPLIICYSVLCYSSTTCRPYLIRPRTPPPRPLVCDDMKRRLALCTEKKITSLCSLSGVAASYRLDREKRERSFIRSRFAKKKRRVIIAAYSSIDFEGARLHRPIEERSACRSFVVCVSDALAGGRGNTMGATHGAS